MTSASTEWSQAGFQRLSQESVQRLHENFMARIRKSAMHVVPENAPDRDELLEGVTGLLLAAERQRVKLEFQELREIVAAGQDAISEQTRKLGKRHHFRSDQIQKISRAAASRHENERVRNAFGNHDRIYLKFSGTLAEQSDTRLAVQDYLRSRRLLMEDYNAGYATDEAARSTYRIGKLLAKDDRELFFRFLTDPSRTINGTLAVISRNADDIARMSANRGWQSCMSPDRREFSQYVHADIARGTLVAYLISKNDPEINDPLARVLLKPFELWTKDERKWARYTGNDGSWFAEDHRLLAAFGKAAIEAKLWLTGRSGFEKGQIYIMERTTYGLSNPLFSKAVQSFVTNHFNRGSRAGEYRLVKGLHADSISGTTFLKADGTSGPPTMKIS